MCMSHISDMLHILCALSTALGSSCDYLLTIINTLMNLEYDTVTVHVEKRMKLLLIKIKSYKKTETLNMAIHWVVSFIVIIFPIRVHIIFIE